MSARGQSPVRKRGTDAMKRFRVVREIAAPVAIALCFAGLSAFSH